MRRFVSWVGVLAVVWVTAAVAAAQGKPGLEQLDRVMKKDGPAQQTLVKALVSGNQAVAKTNLATLKSGITEAQAFLGDQQAHRCRRLHQDCVEETRRPRQISQRPDARFDRRARRGAGLEQILHGVSQGLPDHGR